MDRFRLLNTLLLTGLLAACAGPQRIDSTVNSFARWDAAPSDGAAVPTGPQRYQFERLPSQGAGSAALEQDSLEAVARRELEVRGWTLADAGPPARWTVQVSASTVRDPRDPLGDRGSWSLHGHIVAGNGHFFWSPMFMFPPDPPDYLRQVTVLVREMPGGRVVYETRASHESRWNSTPALWQAIVAGALKDFPKPPTGPRQVEVDLPPKESR